MKTSIFEQLDYNITRKNGFMIPEYLLLNHLDSINALDIDLAWFDFEL